MTPALFVSLKSRLRQPELMDSPDVAPDELRGALNFLQRVNRLLGYSRSSIHHLARFSRHWRPDQPIRILDVATGSGDIPRDIITWSRRRNFNVQITALDRHARTAQIANRQLAGYPIRVIQA